MAETNQQYLDRLLESLDRLIKMGASPLYIKAVQKRIDEVVTAIRDEVVSCTNSNSTNSMTDGTSTLM